MRYTFTLTGRTPLLMSNDSVEWGDAVKEWLADPDNRDQKGPAGDDRGPAWTWFGRLYHDGARIAVPADNLMACLRDAGKKVKHGRGSAKEISQSAVWIDEEFLPVVFGDNAGPAEIGSLQKLVGVNKFDQHLAAAKKLGFRLFMKRAKPSGMGSGKHVRIRPVFDRWRLNGTLEVTDDDALPMKTLLQLFDIAGRRVGLCDWRPGAPKSPGRFGMFGAELKPAK